MDICWLFTAVCSAGSVVWVPALLRQPSIACGLSFCKLLTCYCCSSSGEDAKGMASSSVNQSLVLDTRCVLTLMCKDMAGSNGWWRFDHYRASYQGMATTCGHACFLWARKSKRLFEPVECPYFASQELCMAVVNSDICYFQMHYKEKLE